VSAVKKNQKEDARVDDGQPQACQPTGSTASGNQPIPTGTEFMVIRYGREPRRVRVVGVYGQRVGVRTVATGRLAYLPLREALRLYRLTQSYDCDYMVSMDATRMVKVETVRLACGCTGRHIRIATKVTLEDGRQVTFMERMPKGKAIAQAREVVARG
jgi:hypothetical protein